MSRAEARSALFDRARRDRSHLFDMDRLTALLVEARLDAVIASTGTDVSYTAGVFTKGEETPDYVVTTADSRQALISAADYAQNFAQTSWVGDIRPFPVGDHADVVALQVLRDALIDLGLGEATVGINGALAALHRSDLSLSLPGVNWADGSQVLDTARAVKTPGEVELYRAAMEVTQEAVQQTWQQSRAGDTEKTLSARMQSIGLGLGADWTSHCQLQTGAHSTVAMAASLESAVQPGDVVHVDYGGIFCGYRTDYARNAVVGRPSPRQASIYARLAEIQNCLIDAIRPGMTGDDVWTLGMEGFDRSHGLVHPWSMLGHGVGLSLHEGLHLAAGSADVLQPGMLINVEPSHFEPGDARYHIEDTLLITDNGVEVLANAEVSSTSWVAPEMASISTESEVRHES